MRPLRALAVTVAATVLPLSTVAAAGAAPAPAGSAGTVGSAITAPGLTAPVRLVRTTDGIAHLSAANRPDLWFAQGWLHATDRLFQMDTLRRTASGTLAELLGPGALPSDVQLRTLGLRRAAERSWAEAPARLRDAVTAYTAGVNAKLAAGGALPPEYGALELTAVAPWTPADTIVIGKLVSFQLSFDLDADISAELQAYVTGGAAAGIDGRALYLTDLVAHAPFSSASTVPDATRTPPRDGAARTAAVDRTRLAAAARLAGRYRAAAAKVPLLQEVLDRREHATGSNEWVVSGRHTKDGRPILANDPHLGLSNPSIFYPVHLRAPGLDAAGEGFAGVPGFAQGQNTWIAWGSTTNPMDVTDTYLEAVRPDPASPSGYATVYKGQLEPVLAVPETFRANGVGDGQPDTVAVVPPGNGIPPATLIVPRRNNGPIVQLDAAAGTALSVQYVGYSPTRELDAFLQWLDARATWTTSGAACAASTSARRTGRTPTGAGNIAYFTSGELPLREDLQAGTVAGQAAVPDPQRRRAATSGCRTASPAPGQARRTRSCRRPRCRSWSNPPAGWFVNANNDPVGTTLDNDPLDQLRPGGGIFYLNPGYDGLRAGRITEALTGRSCAGARWTRPTWPASRPTRCCWTRSSSPRGSGPRWSAARCPRCRSCARWPATRRWSRRSPGSPCGTGPPRPASRRGTTPPTRPGGRSPRPPASRPRASRRRSTRSGGAGSSRPLWTPWRPGWRRRRWTASGR